MLVKNAVVKLPWEAEQFFETKESGFAAAVQIYTTPEGTFPVIFKDRVACFLIDTDTSAPATFQEIRNALAQMFKANTIDDTLEETFPDVYCEIGVQGCLTNEEVLDSYGFSEEQKQDVADRMNDLEGYWEEIVEDPFA